MNSRVRGFTLLEVLVALAVLAIAMGALIKTASEGANNIGYLKQQTLAGWVASNRINQIMLDEDWPEVGSQQGTVEMGGQEWRWEMAINETADEDLRRLDVTVRLPDKTHPLVRLVAFKGRN